MGYLLFSSRWLVHVRSKMCELVWPIFVSRSFLIDNIKIIKMSFGYQDTHGRKILDCQVPKKTLTLDPGTSELGCRTVAERQRAAHPQPTCLGLLADRLCAAGLGCSQVWLVASCSILYVGSMLFVCWGRVGGALVWHVGKNEQYEPW